MNISGLLVVAFLVLWFPCCGVVGHQIRKRIGRKKPDPKPDRVAPAPVHVHILDVERGNITVTDIGGVLARCIVAGCEQSVYIAPNLARSFVVEGVEVRG